MQQDKVPSALSQDVGPLSVQSLGQQSPPWLTTSWTHEPSHTSTSLVIMQGTLHDDHLIVPHGQIQLTK